MKTYKVGDKFVIEIVEVICGYGNKEPDPLGFIEPLYRVKGFNTLVFDAYGLNKLQKINPKLKIEDIDDMLAEYDLKQESYNKGLNDAWELAEKIIRMDADHKFEIFGEGIVAAVIAENTPQEALAKIEAYEKSKEEIKVGDVVKYKALSGKYVYAVVVSSIESKDDRYDDTLQCVLYDGTIMKNARRMFTKTGKYIDIQGILNEIEKENEHDGE